MGDTKRKSVNYEQANKGVYMLTLYHPSHNNNTEAIITSSTNNKSLSLSLSIVLYCSCHWETDLYKSRPRVLRHLDTHSRTLLVDGKNIYKHVILTRTDLKLYFLLPNCIVTRPGYVTTTPTTTPIRDKLNEYINYFLLCHTFLSALSLSLIPECFIN